MSNSFIVDVNIPKDALKELKKYGNIIFSHKLTDVYYPVNSHPDIQIYFCDNKLAYTTKSLKRYYQNFLSKSIRIEEASENLGSKYPDNVLFNIASFGNFVVCNKKYTSKDIIHYYENTDKNIISVKQGYAKCNICVISDNAVITEDNGIYKELSKNNIDVLLINPGYVRLDKFDYGFIGGASGFIDKDTIGFIGRVENHPQFDEIKDFILKHDKKFVSLGNGGLTDCGSILMV